MSWIHPISAEVEETAEALGGKGHGLVILRRLGLPVPPGFVIGTAACRAFLRDGRLPDGLDAELADALSGLEAATGRKLGGTERPLAVAVRSGSSVSMPGMMSTVLNLGLTDAATTALAAETADPRFALDSRLRFLSSYATEVLGLERETLAAIAQRVGTAVVVRNVEDTIRTRTGEPVGEDAARHLERAIAAVFSSWDTPRAITYRALHDIPADLGTAVTVQAMVFGNRDGRSGTGVAFSRDPNTGEPVPFGEVLFGHQGEEVVSGRSLTSPLRELAEREPAVWAGLLDALERIEAHYRDACYVEFTFEAGQLWLLQVRPGRLVGRAAVRVAVDLADAGTIERSEALLRITPQQLRQVRTPRIAPDDAADVLARGLGASPGVAVGRVATSADSAARMAAQGPVVLVRPETSPLDMHGLAAAVGIVTSRGGPTSHAAVVARSLGKPAVVGAAGLTVDAAAGALRVAGRTLPEGTLIALDGTSGEVVVGRPRVVDAGTDPRLHRLLAWADEVAGKGGDFESGEFGRDEFERDEAARLTAAQAVLRRSTPG
ncbi:pyruvate,orthophosphate dikinase [Kitasatospora sp. GP30]|uniref:pyruvate, phosphate dikinase n=1 Tax=Kitasatospora sp. GP30 TaxID=3035084 RepID=UPI000C706BAD|nr:pyruvate, phosphate dikinase [Kitasatospora sp. GP30]MDH6142361.1 pyruvate,orthophosphate dikinase [Kitasatospora sp. GP30]